MILRKIWKWFYRILIAMAVMLILFAVWFYYAVRIDTPEPKDLSVLKLSRVKINDHFSRIGNNWLKKSESGLWEIYVEGDGFERGVIEGKLHKELAEIQEIAFVDQIKKMIPSPWMLNYMKYFIAFFNRHLDEYVTDEYQEEIYGESLFASDKFDFIAPKYHRMLNYHAAHDIGHALQDKNISVGCTSFSAWSDKTTDSSLLVGRNFDFYVGDAFAQNKLINFVNPKNGYKLMMVSWAGMIGTVSGMNEMGLTVTINASKSDIPTSAATPVSLVAREILQYARNISEAFEIAKKRKVFVSESLLIGSLEDGKTVTIEKTPSKTELYESDKGNFIICSNHYLGKAFKNDTRNKDNILNSSSQYRLDRMNELLSVYPRLNEKDAAAILRDRKGKDQKDIGMGNEKSINQLIAHHSVIFKPGQLKVWVSTNPYQLGRYVCYDLNKIFKIAPGMRNPIELYEKDLSIAEDSFLNSPAYHSFISFRKMRESFIRKTQNADEPDMDYAVVGDFIASNPEYYDTYRVLADYYLSRDSKSEAIKYYQRALSKEISTATEKKDILSKLEKLNGT